MELKKCLSCGAELKGRIDKKFCNDWCRNAFNNKLNVESQTVKNINAILKKNRKIIEDIIPKNTETAKASKQKLIDKGFNFNYYTNILTTKKGTQYYFCYDFGYLIMDNDYYFLVKKTSHSENG